MLFDRVTNVESHFSCAYKSHNLPFVSDKDNIIKTYTGDICHIAHNNPDLALKLAEYFCWEYMIELKTERDSNWIVIKKGTRDNVLLSQIKQVIEFAKERIKERETQGDTVYFETKVQIIWSWCNITGTNDCALLRTNLPMKIVDYKIVASTERYKKPEEKMQAMLYSLGMMRVFWLQEIEFEYLCYKKNKKILIEKYSCIFKRDELEEKVWWILERYVFEKEWWIYEPNTWSHCFSCPLYRADKAHELWMLQCPKYRQEFTIDWFCSENDID